MMGLWLVGWDKTARIKISGKAANTKETAKRIA
jgi:hypothetical protein